MSSRITKLLKYLHKETDFNTSPASSRFHGSYRGGLKDHSWNVVNELRLLTIRHNLNWQDVESIVIIGLGHDICKTGSYYWDETKQEYYKGYSDDKRHAEKSVEMLKDIITLTEEEELCIRWHMGAFDKEENWNKFTEAIHKYPNVFWTHTADMIASHIKEINYAPKTVIESRCDECKHDCNEDCGHPEKENSDYES